MLLFNKNLGISSEDVARCEDFQRLSSERFQEIKVEALNRKEKADLNPGNNLLPPPNIPDT